MQEFFAVVIKEGVSGAIVLLIAVIAYKIYKSRCHERFSSKNFSIELSSAELPGSVDAHC